MSTAHTKSVAVHVKGAGAPDTAQLAAIRAHTLRDFAADDLVVREFVVAHNAIDRDKECFAAPLLEDFARTFGGKGVFIRHPSGWDGDSGPGEGKIFAAVTERMTHDAARTLLREPHLAFPYDAAEAVVVKASAYYVKTPENVAFLLKLDAGIAGEVSIGFTASTRERLKDAAGIELNAWRWNGPGEARELSHVWLGAQPGARAIKSAPRTPDPETTMDEAQIKALQTENATLKTAAAEHGKAAALVADVRKALGDNAALLDTPAVLAKAVADGKLYRKSLIADLVTMERHLKITGDGEDQVKAATDLYADIPTEKLIGMQKALESRMPQGGSKVVGSDPNAGKPGAGGAPAEGSIAANPVFGAVA